MCHGTLTGKSVVKHSSSQLGDAGCRIIRRKCGQGMVFAFDLNGMTAAIQLGINMTLSRLPAPREHTLAQLR